jgi:hypothetical protein
MIVMVGQGFESYEIPVSDGDVIAVEVRPAIYDDQPCRELTFTVPMGITAGEIARALGSIGVDPATELLRSEAKSSFPKSMILVFRLP